MKRFYQIIICLVFILSFTACSPKVFFALYRWGEYGYIKNAEEALRQKKYDQACELYQKHIEYRLSVIDRPEWENPYFYYLIIGDIRLRQSKVEEALSAYELAEKMKIEPQLVSDRYRFVAGWYEENGELKKAIKVLETYRNRDLLLFDAMLDRLAREIVKKEDETKSD
ncbi:MAG: hypothetical protein SGJ02_02490 [bacterium]|nr:hypothetical protein [bacterium]